MVSAVPRGVNSSRWPSASAPVPKPRCRTVSVTSRIRRYGSRTRFGWPQSMNGKQHKDLSVRVAW